MIIGRSGDNMRSFRTTRPIGFVIWVCVREEEMKNREIWISVEFERNSRSKSQEMESDFTSAIPKDSPSFLFGTYPLRYSI